MNQQRKQKVTEGSKKIADCGLQSADSKQKVAKETKANLTFDGKRGLHPPRSQRPGGPVKTNATAQSDWDGALKSWQLAEKIQVSERMIRKLVAQKKIPVMRLGRLLRFDYDAVQKALTVAENKNGVDGTIATNGGGQ